MAKGKPRSDNRADTRGGGWVGIPHCVVDSPAYRHASLWARAVLVEIAREFNGYNNGRIALSFNQLCERLNNSNRRKLTQALAELVEHGLIAVEFDGDWKPRLSREYRLTWVTTGDRNSLRAATNEYRSWTPTKKFRGDDVSPEKGQSGNASSPERENAGDASLPAKFAKLRKSAIFEQSSLSSSGDDVSPLICKPYPPAQIDGAEGEDGSSESSYSTAGHRCDAETDHLDDDVRTTLAGIRRSSGLIGTRSIATASAVEHDRLLKWIDGLDSLSPPMVARLCRAVNATAPGVAAA